MMPSCRYAIVLLLTAASVAAAQEPEPEFAKYLFPPELVMQHQQALRLTPEQRTSITQGIRDLQLKVVDLQWKMQDEAQKLTELVQGAKIDEAQTLAQVDRVLGWSARSSARTWCCSFASRTCSRRSNRTRSVTSNADAGETRGSAR